MVPIGMACAPHPPCVMPRRQTVHGCRIAHAQASSSSARRARLARYELSHTSARALAPIIAANPCRHAPLLLLEVDDDRAPAGGR